MQNKLNNKNACPQCLKHSFCRRGFAIVEALFGVSIFVLIVLALTFWARNVWTYNSFISLSLANVDAGRQAMKIMTSEIRTASSANTGAYAVSDATASSFGFYSDIYDNGLKEKVRYFLNGSMLQKGVTIPTGSPLAYDSNTEVITNLVNNVTSASIFSYYDKNYDGTTAALATPVDLSSIRLVKINIVVDKDPLRSPAPFTFSTQVSMRNLKDNL